MNVALRERSDRIRAPVAKRRVELNYGALRSSVTERSGVVSERVTERKSDNQHGDVDTELRSPATEGS